jgi:uncharacterized protein with HEPN domain
MARAASKTQDAYLYGMRAAAVRIHGYMAGVTYEEFRENSEKRDAVALRISVIGEAAYHINRETELAWPGIPFKGLRGMRNRIAHDYDAVNFKLVWEVTQKEIEPLIAALDAYFKGQTKG